MSEADEAEAAVGVRTKKPHIEGQILKVRIQYKSLRILDFSRVSSAKDHGCTVLME
jgi:hypothetical protein